MKAILTIVAAGVLCPLGARGQGNPVREYVYLGGRMLAVDNMPMDNALTATPNVISSPGALPSRPARGGPATRR